MLFTENLKDKANYYQAGAKTAQNNLLLETIHISAEANPSRWNSGTIFGIPGANRKSPGWKTWTSNVGLSEGFMNPWFSRFQLSFFHSYYLPLGLREFGEKQFKHKTALWKIDLVLKAV